MTRPAASANAISIGADMNHVCTERQRGNTKMRGRVASSNAEHAISPLARCQYVTAPSTSPSQPSSHRARAAIARHATSRPGRMGHDAIRETPRRRAPASAPGTPHRLPASRRWRSTRTLQRLKNPRRPTQSPRLQAIPCVAATHGFTTKAIPPAERRPT